jgi:hypothetical protein
MTIKRILFPFDFSDQGFLAAGFVRATAERFGARAWGGRTNQIIRAKIGEVPSALPPAACCSKRVHLTPDSKRANEFRGADKRSA